MIPDTSRFKSWQITTAMSYVPPNSHYAFFCKFLSHPFNFFNTYNFLHSYIWMSVSARFRDVIKRLLKRLRVLCWIQKQELLWESKLLPYLGLSDTHLQVTSSIQIPTNFHCLYEPLILNKPTRPSLRNRNCGIFGGPKQELLFLGNEHTPTSRAPNHRVHNRRRSGRANASRCRWPKVAAQARGKNMNCSVGRHFRATVTYLKRFNDFVIIK